MEGSLSHCIPFDARENRNSFFYFDKHGGYLFETFYLNNSEGVTKSFEPLQFIGSF